MKKTAVCLLMSVTLLGCGGGNDSTPSVPTNPSTPTDPKPANPSNPPSASELLPGIYTGITGQREAASGLVDDNKRLWVIYSDENLYQDGGVLGFINSNNNVVGNSGTFSVQGNNYSYDARAALDTTITGDYRTPKSLKGEVFGLPVNSTSYNMSFDETQSTKIQTLASLSNRTFFGDSYVSGDTSAGTTTIKFGSNGNFSGNGEGCSLSGTMKPSASKRYFEGTVTFGAYPCYAARETLTGVAILNEDNELIVLGTDAQRTKGLFFSSAE